MLPSSFWDLNILKLVLENWSLHYGNIQSASFGLQQLWYFFCDDMKSKNGFQKWGQNSGISFETR